MSSVGEQVKEIIVKQLGVEADQVKDQAKFVEDLGADSLDIVELVMAMEDKFSVSIPEDEAENLKTVGDTISYIQDLQK